MLDRVDPQFRALPLAIVADAALDRARALGAQHADVRVERILTQTISLRDGSVTGDALATRAWAPPVDVRETNEHVILTAELPGLEPEDVEVTLQDQILSISGQRTLEKAAEGENVRRVERSYGSFRRSFAVPPHLAADKIDAKFDKGVLTLTLPKAEVAKPRRIEIK